jgi:hypothetical protein
MAGYRLNQKKKIYEIYAFFLKIAKTEILHCFDSWIVVNHQHPCNGNLITETFIELWNCSFSFHIPFVGESIFEVERG